MQIIHMAYEYGQVLDNFGKRVRVSPFPRWLRRPGNHVLGQGGRCRQTTRDGLQGIRDEEFKEAIWHIGLTLQASELSPSLLRRSRLNMASLTQESRSLEII
jgi:hypothetical protein